MSLENKSNPCPTCNDTRFVLVEWAPEYYVSRDMALDAGIPEMEGTVYSEARYEYVPCPNCLDE